MPFTIPTFKVKSPRKMIPELDEIICAKAIEICPERFQKACADLDALALVDIAGDCMTALKVREKTGNNDGVLVEMIQKVAGGSKGQPWCMWQVQTLVSFAEVRTGIVSRLPGSGSCAVVRTKTPKDMQIPMIQSIPGTIWIKKYKDGSGHTGEFTGWIKLGVSANLNEGNTTGGMLGEKTIREGGGSYFTARNIKDKAGDWIMAILPFPAHGAADVKAPPAQSPAKYPVFGDRSDAVGTLQRALNKQEFPPLGAAKLKVDLQYGVLTRAALAAYQMHAHVGNVMGEVDAATWNSLGLS